MVRISFIVPTFNRAEYIAESLRSITSQFQPADEILVVDDGSDADIQDIVRGVSPDIRFIRQQNAGKSVALNRALSMTSGQYVWICDDDDLLLPGAVDALFGQIEASSAGLVFGRYTRFRTEGARRVDFGGGYWPDLSTGSLARHILEDAFVMHNAALTRRSAYEAAGPFNPSMLRSQDYDMFVRLALTTPVLFHDRVIFEQRKHDSERGPLSIVHAAGESERVWEEYDRSIFKKMKANVPIEFFESMFMGCDRSIIARAALLQRACIMGRHGLWAEALDDISFAASIQSKSPLCSLEISICRRIGNGKQGLPSLLDPSNFSLFEKIFRSSDLGREILGFMLDGMLWRLREQEASSRNAARSIIAMHCKARIFPMTLLKAFFRRNAADDCILSERSHPVMVGSSVAKSMAT